MIVADLRIYMITICRDSLTRGKTLQADVIPFYLSFQAFLYCQDMPAPQAKVFSAGIYDIREIVMIKKTPSVTCHMKIF